MRSIVIAGLFVLAATAAQADIVCTQHGGCRETGKKIIAVDPSFSNGQCVVTERNGKKQRVCINRVPGVDD